MFDIDIVIKYDIDINIYKPCATFMIFPERNRERRSFPGNPCMAVFEAHHGAKTWIINVYVNPNMDDVDMRPSPKQVADFLFFHSNLEGPATINLFLFPVFRFFLGSKTLL